MGRSTPFLPSTLRGRLAVVGTLALLYIFATTLYTIRPYLHHSFRPQVESPGLDSLTSSSPSPSVPPTTLKNSSDDTPPKVLIVTSWFPVQNPLFTEEDYNEWLPYFFGSNTNDIYLYTTPEFEARFRSLRNSDNGHKLTINTNFSSPFDIPPLKGKEEAYERNMKKDRAKSKKEKSTDLYANRNAKPFFLSDAVSRLERLGRTYDFVFWSDAGSFREKHVYTEWPALKRLEQIWEASAHLPGATSKSSDDLVFIPTSRGPHPSMIYWTESMGPIDNDISIGSFFGGKPHAMDWFMRTYYAYHEYYLSFDIFIGKNQALINSLLFLYPNRFITVWVHEQDDSGLPSSSSFDDADGSVGQCGPQRRRFYYEFWLAGDVERKKMQDLWIAEASAWHWWGWWKTIDRTPCKISGVLGVETVLKSTLGTDWKPPVKVVEIPEKTGWEL